MNVKKINILPIKSTTNQIKTTLWETCCHKTQLFSQIHVCGGRTTYLVIHVDVHRTCRNMFENAKNSPAQHSFNNSNNKVLLKCVRTVLVRDVALNQPPFRKCSHLVHIISEIIAIKFDG